MIGLLCEDLFRHGPAAVSAPDPDSLIEGIACNLIGDLLVIVVCHDAGNVEVMVMVIAEVKVMVSKNRGWRQ